MADDVDAVMQTIPEGWRTRWCGGEEGPCACMGCVQIGNRLVMTGTRVTLVDPEYINESKIPHEVYQRHKITREEWDDWMRRHHPNWGQSG